MKGCDLNFIKFILNSSLDSQILFIVISNNKHIIIKLEFKVKMTIDIEFCDCDIKLVSNFKD